MENPLVSVVIPVWNQEKYIAEAIDSVLNQSYQKIELVVVDDGSTDKTSDIVKGYGNRLVYIRQKNKGASTALNVGTKRSKGELVGWLSSDDVYFRKKIEEQVKYFDKHPFISLVYTDFQEIDSTGRITSTVRSPYYNDHREFIRNMILGNFVNGSSILAKKEDLLRAGLFDPRMKYHADGDMWFRILKFGKFGHVPKVLLKYRWHSGNASRDKSGMKAFLYIYFDKIINEFNPNDLFEGVSTNLAEKKFHSLISMAAQRNGLYDLAFIHLIKSGINPRAYFSLGRHFLVSSCRNFLIKAS